MGTRSKLAYSLLPVLLFLGLWETAARLAILPGHILVPSFTEVVEEFFLLLQSGLLLRDFGRSLLRVMIGFVSGALFGLLAGIFMGWRAFFYRALSPVLSLLYPIPALGWLPLLMLWVGINDLLPIAIIFICSFFPVCYNTAAGVRNVDPGFVKAARTLGASERRILFRVILPLAVPSIFTGLRLESGMAWRVVIAAEMVAIPTGIGALMMRAESLIRMDIIMVCLMVLSLMCFLFERFFSYMESRLTSRWKKDALPAA